VERLDHRHVARRTAGFRPRVNKVRKLGRTNAGDGHLVVLDSFSPQVWAFRWHGPRATSADQPSTACPSVTPPDPLTHVWLLPMMGTREGLLWRRRRMDDHR
jgi:hypothetical protein